MVPLLVGGRGVIHHRLAGRTDLKETLSKPALCLRAIGAFLLAQAILCVVGSNAWADQQTGQQTGTPQVIRVGVVSPMAVKQPTAWSDWTLREPVSVAKADGAAKAQKRGPTRAEVSMFSWREILFYAMVVVVVIGGFLAFTGGQGRQSRHY